MRCIAPFVKKGEQGIYHEYPCGKCPACRTRRVQQWAYRLLEECNHHDRLFFPTFTYSDDRLPLISVGDSHVMTLDRKQIQDYVKRLRKNTGASFKYYFVGEYGGTTFRPHYHAIIYSDKLLDHEAIISDWRDVVDGDILGNVFFGDVRSASIKYVVGYLNKEVRWDDLDLRQRPFANISKGLGLGALTPQLESLIFNGVATEQEFIYFEGAKISVPRYFRDKVFPDGIERILPPARKFSPQEITNAIAWTNSYFNKHGKRKN